MSEERIQQRRKNNRAEVSFGTETVKKNRGGRPPRSKNKVPFKDKSPEEQAEIRAAKSRAGSIGGKNTNKKLTTEEIKNRTSNAGKAAAKKDRETGYKNLENARGAKIVYKALGL